ncbi:MAG: M67 family metallopeptidase [Rhodospirillales bacterium]|nr:M67 family metallopeptidase [Rhodospirillales bacterium]
MIHISPTHLDQINTLAQRAYPGECCGLLVGRTEPDGSITVTRIVPSANVADPPGNDRFEVSPKVRFDLMRQLNGTEKTIVGHYHSHPDQAAEPSATDLSMAFEPDLIWLITAVTSRGAGQTQAWCLNRETGAVQTIVLKIGESA